MAPEGCLPVLLVLALGEALDTEDAGGVLPAVAAVVARLWVTGPQVDERVVSPPGLNTWPQMAGGVSASESCWNTPATSALPAMNCSRESSSTSCTFLSSCTLSLSTLVVPCLWGGVSSCMLVEGVETWGQGGVAPKPSSTPGTCSIHTSFHTAEGSV